jgi:hypothetical protein
MGAIHAMTLRSFSGIAVAGPDRALADITLVRVRSEGEGISVSTTKYGGGEGGRGPVRLFPTRPTELNPISPDLEVVDLLICNISDIVTPDEINDRAEHFLMYYDLLAQPPAAVDRPIPIATQSSILPQAVEPGDLPRVFDAIDGNPGHGGPSRPICNEVKYGTANF